MSNYCDYFQLKYFHPEISQSTFTDRLGLLRRGRRGRRGRRRWRVQIFLQSPKKPARLRPVFQRQLVR
jgi:hypothetical protein